MVGWVDLSFLPLLFLARHERGGSKMVKQKVAL